MGWLLFRTQFALLVELVNHQPLLWLTLALLVNEPSRQRKPVRTQRFEGVTLTFLEQ